VIERVGQGEVTLSYDSVGNLTEWTLPAPYREVYLTRHTVGPRNQVMAVTPIGQEDLEQTFEYDANGRPVRIVQSGRREVILGYDELSRLTDVHLDGEHVLTARHGPMDVDPIHDADAHTPFTTVDQPVASAVFGSLEEIAFARLEGTPHGFVRFVPSMARFVIRDPLIPPPDAVLLASLKRRNLVSRATLTPEPIQGFDKPSNSLFIPPEYFSVNCWYCVAGASGFDLDRVGSGPVAIGQTVNFVADADYSVCYSYQSWWPEIPEIWYYEGGWNHRILVNGAYVTQFPGHSLGWENHEDLEFGLSFGSSGQKTVTDELRCSCDNIFMAQAEESVAVCQDPYLFHNPIWTYDTPTTHVTRSGALNSGQLSIDVKVYTSTQLKFDWFQSYVTNRWNKTVTGNGVNVTIAINLHRVGSVGEADVQVDYPPSNPINPIDPDSCGYHDPNTAPHSIVVFSDGSGQGCDEVKTSAHEYGHHLGFRNAYAQPAPNALHCDQNDVMSWGNLVQWYHGRILWEKY
jgi:YD repeat-containing protein